MTLHPAITQRHVSATLASLLLLLLQSIPLHAQNHDIRLSDDPFQPLLTTEAQIQSAASIGSVTLAVWGSTASEGDSVRPVLYGQFLRDRVPVDTAFVVTQPEARPSRFVQVVSLDDRFLVVWNDRRRASLVTWCTRVDTLGQIGLEEQLLDSGIIAAVGVFAAPIDGGHILYWDFGRPDSLRTQARGLNSDGSFNGPAFTTLLPPIQRMFRSPFGSDSVYADCGTDQMYRVDRNAGWTKVTLPNKGVVSIGPDGSMITVIGNKIAAYHSITDASPFQYYPVSTPSGEIPANVIPGTVVAFFDPFGRIGRAYCTSIWTSNSGYTFLEIHPHVSFLNPDNQYGKLIYLDVRIDKMFDHHYYATPPIVHPAVVDRYCTNSIRLTYSIDYLFSLTDNQGHTRIDSTTTHPQDVISYNSYNFILDSLTTCYRTTFTYPVAQRKNTDPSQSTIIVIFGLDTTFLHAPIGLTAKNVVEWLPTIAASDTSIFVAWFRSGIDSVINLARWNPQSSGAIEPVAILSLKRYRKIDSVTTRTSMQLLSSGGTCFAAIHVDSLSSPTSKRAFAQHNSLLRADQDGWHSLYETDTTEADSINKIRSVTVDLDDHSALVVAGGGGDLEAARNIHVAEFDARGVQRWRADSFPDVKVGDFVALPLSEDYFFVGTRWSTSLYRGSNPLGTLDHPDSVKGLESRFLSLFKGKYLQWYVTKGRLDVEMFDTTFQRVGVISLPAGITAVSNSIVLQNPVDSGFAIVYGKNDGLHLTVIDKNLKLVKSDTIISESRDTARHPSAVYVGDTLTVVWESYRKGVVDIYGTSRVAPAHIPPASRDASPASGDRISTLRPNPTHDRIFVELSTPVPSGTTWQILDATGGSVMRGDMPSGATYLDIATPALPSGYYFLSVEFAGERNVQGFVVQR